jgi:hypothetical protein
LKIMGVDPGSAETAYCLVNEDLSIMRANKISNQEFLNYLSMIRFPFELAIEGIQSYGMVVGREIFDTCYMIGRTYQVCENSSIGKAIYNRPEYARAICGVGKVNDAVLRQVLMTRFGGDRKGEPLNQLKGCSDLRSAFAVAVYHADLSKYGRVVNGNP